MTLTELNISSSQVLKEALTKCCGSESWVEKMTEIFPVQDEDTLLNEAQKAWYQCNEPDWREAFTHHPKIGDINSLKEKFASTQQWAAGEQAAVKETSNAVLQALAKGNQLYEQKFNYIFIFCATGRSAEEMLASLQIRLLNPPDVEIKIAMEEQNKITKLRLQKLLLP